MEMKEVYDFIATRTGKYKILVVGDVMLDMYYYSEVKRISPEAPVPIARVVREKETLGGAANVAHNLALLGCQTLLAGFVGDDYHCQSLREKLTTRGIVHEGLIQTEAPTTTKLRIIGGHQQMMRLDFEETAPPAEANQKKLFDYIDKRLNESLDCLIISDYAKGACAEKACEHIIKTCHAHGVPVIIDPKGSSWTKYAGADYVTPNLKEINEILNEPIENKDAAVERAAQYIRRKYSIKNVVATRSECGLSFINEKRVLHIPTKAQEVFDVSGAGDTVIAVFSMALAGGLKPEDSAYLANLAASVVVAKLGTYAVSREELLAVLNKVNNLCE